MEVLGEPHFRKPSLASWFISSRSMPKSWEALKIEQFISCLQRAKETGFSSRSSSLGTSSMLSGVLKQVEGKNYEGVYSKLSILAFLENTFLLLQGLKKSRVESSEESWIPDF